MTSQTIQEQSGSESEGSANISNELQVPNLALAQQAFLLTCCEADKQTREAARDHIWAAIQENSMGPWYSRLLDQMSMKSSDMPQLPNDINLKSQMDAANRRELAELDAKVKDAEEKAVGETEIAELLAIKAHYYAKIGDKENAIQAYRQAFDKTPGTGAKIDLVFSLVRVGFFFNDHDIITQQLEKAKKLIEDGGDWDRRNRCKVYEATFLMQQRDFKKSCELFLETLPTFTSVELMPLCDYVQYCVLMSAISLERPQMKQKVIDAPEVLEVVHQIPNLDDYMRALYDCRYASFFTSLAAMETIMKTNYFLNLHYRYYVREMRIKAYAQLLESYSALTLKYMAETFNVSQKFVDRDLYRFIALGRINCVIDKVSGIVETNRPDVKNAQYQAIIKQGDLLLNRVQKLGKVIDL